MRKWTNEEDKYLIDNISKYSNHELALALNRTDSAVYTRVSYLKLNRFKYYTTEEDEYIKNNYKTLSYAEIAKNINRTVHSVEARRSFLGLKKNSHKFYTEKDTEKINNAKTINDRLILAKEFNISYRNMCLAIKRRGNGECNLSCIYRAMIDRCYRTCNAAYDNYGGRGIKICDEWLDDRKFVEWAINNGYSEGLSLDRINNNGNYSPDNCRWTTYKVQANNKRNNLLLTAFGETKTLAQWSEDPRCSVRYSVLQDRIYRGLLDKITPEQLITLELRQTRKIKKEQNVNL